MKKIFTNQLGFLPGFDKKATLLCDGKFTVCDDNNQVVLAGNAEYLGKDEASGDEAYIADFTGLQKPGRYYICDQEGNTSYKFEISNNIYSGLLKDLIKVFYFQRCGCALEEKNAGMYKHACCHKSPVKIFESQDIVKDMSGGWHDAGDFGRYAAPGAVAVGHMLYAYLMFPDSFREEINIPESGNKVPDVLNECRYELEWLLKCQREDGAVYHKVSTLHHAAFVMPEEDLGELYAYPIASMATGDFAAVMALAYRIYKKYDEAFANKVLEASKKSYEWLVQNPEHTGFKNPEGTGTGEYGDWTDKDERLWAATELYVTTGDSAYLNDMSTLINEKISLTSFGWAEVSGFAGICALTDEKKQVPEKLLAVFRERIIAEANRLCAIAKESGYGVAMAANDFHWGSNGAVGNKAMLLIIAGWITKDRLYYDMAINQLHYVLGRNALGISYITGYGEHAFMHPHNRPTESDEIELPMPGFVSGGPNGHPGDEAAKRAIPEGTAPMKCYVDDWRSYSTNEIAIYWNSPYVFLVAAFVSAK